MRVRRKFAGRDRDEPLLRTNWLCHELRAFNGTQKSPLQSHLNKGLRNQRVNNSLEK